MLLQRRSDSQRADCCACDARPPGWRLAGVISNVTHEYATACRYCRFRRFSDRHHSSVCALACSRGSSCRGGSPARAATTVAWVSVRPRLISRPQAHPSYFGVVGCRPLALQAVGFERQHEGMYRLVWKRVARGAFASSKKRNRLGRIVLC